ncbi:TetR family transcriptional regulator [uncultured Williamsia sp.]|uniref:TetR family transcriptional regulator n=1 Tax=uncultured Williamsia sp. TaxID=259311 RepID=UPI002631B2C3|nr:TetR family transcriptional regulator [uncultured Williamsia sp.]
MTADVGRREAHKIATRRAIRDAADVLFADKGFGATTVREIADTAGVTERTFFRYFPSKEALLVEDILSWLPTLGDTIRARPADETPLDAIENTVLALGDDVWHTIRQTLTWLFHDGPPAGRLTNTAPALLAQFENVIADALADRRRASGDPQSEDVLVDQVLARAGVSALRSAAIRHWQLRVAGFADKTTLTELVQRAFAILRLR